MRGHADGTAGFIVGGHVAIIGNSEGVALGRGSTCQRDWWHGRDDGDVQGSGVVPCSKLVR